MKIRTLKLTPEQLIRAIQGKAPLNSHLPSDMELLDLKYDLFSKQVLAVVRSDSFEDVAENAPVPELNVMQQATNPTGTSTSALIAKLQRPIETRPNLTAPRAQNQEQGNADTGQMEKEFNQEQRKLLKFSVKDDFIILKPIQFLKTEWEDINDTVVGLGGRWVKGDIISYWVVPIP